MRMKKFKLWAILLCLPFLLFSQEAEEPKHRMVEDVYIKVKPGANAAFEHAVKVHNNKFHKDGPYEAQLFKIITGKNIDMYIWEMGDLTFSDLDGRPAAENGHDADWDATVVPHIQKVTSVEFWQYNTKLSHYKEGTNHSMFEIWYFDIEKGKMNNWSSFMEKVQKINEKMDDPYSVWWNLYSQNDGRQVSMSFGFDNWSDLDKGDWEMREEFDKEYGEGEWEKALMDWDASTSPVSKEVWQLIKE